MANRLVLELVADSNPMIRALETFHGLAGGAAFMRETLGMGDGKQSGIQNRIYLDGREIAIAMSDRQPSALWLMGALS